VQAIGQSAAEEAARSEPALADSGYASSHRPRERESGGFSGLIDLIPSLRTQKTPELPRVVEIPVPPHGESPPTAAGEDQLPQFLRKPQPAPPAGSANGDNLAAMSAAGPQPAAIKLSSDSLKLLKATLNELGECRRMLDAAREREW
jgi:hypothetical protein